MSDTREPTFEDVVRDYLANEITDDSYVNGVVKRMEIIHYELGSVEQYPHPRHGQDDIGMCTECDALRCLQRIADE